MMCEEITKLIPQREPIRMVDKLMDVDGDVAQTVLTVRPDNYFIDEDGLLAEPGLIEHIAQSASAFAGHKALEAGATTPPVGYIGEVKKFHCYRRPYVGDELRPFPVIHFRDFFTFNTDRAASRLQKAENDAKQCRFSRAVSSEKRCTSAAFEREGDISQDLLASIAERER